MGIFDNAVLYLDALGLTDVILPFVLIFTVLFAVLMKVAIFSEGEGAAKKPSRRFNSIIALVIALITVIPHVMRTYPTERDPVIILNAFLPGAIVLTILLLVFLMLIGFLGSKQTAHEAPIVGIAAILAIIGLIVVLWRALYPAISPAWLGWLDNDSLRITIIAILVMGLIIYYITGSSDTGEGNYYKSLKELFGG